MLFKTILDIGIFIASLSSAFAGDDVALQLWASPGNNIESYYESMIEERLEKLACYENSGFFYAERRKPRKMK